MNFLNVLDFIPDILKGKPNILSIYIIFLQVNLLLINYLIDFRRVLLLYSDNKLCINGIFTKDLNPDEIQE
uniref:Uncharacterized protein n=1 Tax=Meloidogyne enterolobii TaxID=390850 RepID=A0A6V7Y4Z7_MELEN|nr:unnamed protein product [Meloidogyne enterolobii]